MQNRAPVETIFGFHGCPSPSFPPLPRFHVRPLDVSFGGQNGFHGCPSTLVSTSDFCRAPRSVSTGTQKVNVATSKRFPRPPVLRQNRHARPRPPPPGMSLLSETRPNVSTVRIISNNVCTSRHRRNRAPKPSKRFHGAAFLPWKHFTAKFIRGNDPQKRFTGKRFPR